MVKVIAVVILKPSGAESSVRVYVPSGRPFISVSLVPDVQLMDVAVFVRSFTPSPASVSIFVKSTLSFSLVSVSFAPGNSLVSSPVAFLLIDTSVA